MAELGLGGGGARPKLPDGTTEGGCTRGYKVNQLTAGMGELINNARADGPERPQSPGEQEGNSRATVRRYGPVYDDVLYRLVESGLSGEPVQERQLNAQWWAGLRDADDPERQNPEPGHHTQGVQGKLHLPATQLLGNLVVGLAYYFRDQLLQVVHPQREGLEGGGLDDAREGF